MTFPTARFLIPWISLIVMIAGGNFALIAADIQVDFAKRNGKIRPLNGVNRGPVAAGGLVEVIDAHRALGLHSVRTHDSHWPNCEVIDIHAVFPDFNADPAKPESFEFALTDEYIAGIVKAGAKVVYRLGETIEHTKKKRFVHPPKDYDKWGDICLGIIRHYNEGWANGFHHGIEYWEIWNEPENRPAMWSGSDEDYLRLYKLTAKKIKRAFPKLKVGGPALGASMEFTKDGQCKPYPFTTAFLQMCKRDEAPLDFFSWHCYTDHPVELSQRAKHVRALLDGFGFRSTENHLNEWNLLPDNTWDAGKTPREKDRYFAAMSGCKGAAFIGAAFASMQDAPVDVANLFHGELGNMGLFTSNGAPFKNYFGMLALRRLVDLNGRVEASGVDSEKVGLLAAMDAKQETAMVLIANYRNTDSSFAVSVANLPSSQDWTWELLLVDDFRDLEPFGPARPVPAGIPISVKLPAPSVGLVVIRAKPKTNP